MAWTVSFIGIFEDVRAHLPNRFVTRCSSREPIQRGCFVPASALVSEHSRYFQVQVYLQNSPVWRDLSTFTHQIVCGILQ